MNRVQELEELVEHHAARYYEGEPEISDPEFDDLRAELRRLAPDSRTLLRVGAPPRSNRPKLRHSSLMGSLESVKAVSDLVAWLDACGRGSVVVSPKIDGLAIRLNYVGGQLVEAATRGDGEEGEDVTAQARAVRSIPERLPGFTGELRGEVYMRRSVLEELGCFANCRNAASGSMNLDDPVEVSRRKLDFFCYDVKVKPEMPHQLFYLETDKSAFVRKNLPGVNYVPLDLVDPAHLAAYIYDWEHVKRAELDYDIDGLVFSLESLSDQETAGWAGGCPRGKMAFKFKPEQQVTKLVSIGTQVGRTGKLTPVAGVAPVRVAGSVLRNASLHNWAIVRKLGLRLGDKVLIEKALDIIPQIVRVVEPATDIGPFSPPTECPACKSPAEDDGVNIWCRNIACPARLETRVHYWLKTVGVLGVGPAIVSGLCRHRFVEDLPDLYRLNFNDVAFVTGGKQSAINAIQAILSKNEIPLWRFLAALGIEGLGESRAKSVAARFWTLAAVRMARVSDLIEVEDISDTVAGYVVEGLQRLSGSIDGLLLVIDVQDAEQSSGPLAGKSFAITGTLSRKRDEIAADIESAGGTVKGSVGRGLSYLVQADPASQSSKSKKAASLGIPVISEAELEGMMS